MTENSSDVGAVTATDANTDDLIKFETTGGVDQSLFTIDEDTGVLTFNHPPKFENPIDDDKDNIYNLEVTPTDQDGTVLCTSQNISELPSTEPTFRTLYIVV